MKTEIFQINVNDTTYNCKHEYMNDKQSRKNQNARNNGNFDKSLKESILNYVNEGIEKGLVPYNNFECGIEFEAVKTEYYKSGKSFVYNLFVKRFGNPEGKKSYFEQWLNRDKKGIESFIGKMDFSTRRVFIKCLLNMNTFLPSESIYMKFGRFLVNPNNDNKNDLIKAVYDYHNRQ